MADDPHSAAFEAAPSLAPLSIQRFLELVVERGATDLHISAESPPLMRVHGELMPLPFPPLSANETKNLCYSLLTDSQRHRFEEDSELDFSFGLRGLSRFRGNLFVQKGAIGGAFRLIPYEVRALADLGLPPVVAELTKLPRGLVLVTGPTGSGKSTTLASMLDRINSERHEHIVTVEDPIEFVHQHRKCLVNQREVYADTHGFSEALRHVLRQDPDVVLIGEMRDLETVASALTVAETGHLVLSSLHTNSAVQTINRIIDIFPSNQQPQVRAQLSLVLQAVISQQLIPRLDGKGRVLAVEVMIPNPAIRNLIREEKIHQIYSQLQVGQIKFGMQTMSQSLVDLYQRRLISYDEAMGHATELEEVRSMLGPPPGTRHR
ncbi:MAG TPA: type IV pilus twitching motility protein PilT [Candidatus Acidoferrales bacterium]|nr:type IV pilus twitching motility protein PilT [Candidatus Acidoferrales bacterium]